MDMLLAKCWYFFYFAGMVCVWPYLNLLYRANGLDDAQIGILAAIKPWVSAPSSFLWSGLADRFSIHKTVLLSTFIVSTLTRTSTVAAHSFSAFMLLAAAGEFIAAPVGVMADAAVVAGCKQDTDYGKSRLWGAVAWGGLSTASGWLVSTYGMPSGFAAYLLLSVPCVYCAWHMQFKLGRQQQDQHQQDQLQQHQQQEGKSQGQHAGSKSSKDRAGREGFQQQQQQTAGDWDAADSAAVDVERQSLVQHEHCSSLSGTQLVDVQTQHQHQCRQQQQQCRSGGDCVQQGALDASSVQLVASDSSSSSSSGAAADVLGLAASTGAGAAQPVLGASILPQHQQQPLQQQQQQQQQQRLAVCVGPGSSSDGPSSPSTASSATCVAAAASPSPTPEAAPAQQLQQLRQQHTPDFWRSLWVLLRRPQVLIFMAQATAMGFGIGVIGEFLFLYLDDLGGSETLMGLTLTFTCLAEVPVFHYQGTVLRYISVHTMLHIVMWTYFIRLGCYALLPYAHTPYAVLPVELLHGITFACGWGAGTINSKRVAPPELAATMQGIFQGLYFGVGQGLGALMGGLLKERYGGQVMFAACAAIILGAWLLVVAAELLTGVSSSGNSSSCADDSTAAQQAAAEKASGGLQQQQQEQGQGQQLSGLRGLQLWWQRVRHRLWGSAGGLQGDSSSSSIGSRRRWKQQLYLELGSKDSGPDLGAMGQQ